MEDQTLKDILITAVEGGSNYWARFKRYQPDNGTAEVCDMEASVPTEFPKWRKVTLKTIQRGLNLLAEHKVEICAEYVGEAQVLRVCPDKSSYNAPFADCVLQAGLFGKIIYG